MNTLSGDSWKLATLFSLHLLIKVRKLTSPKSDIFNEFKWRKYSVPYLLLSMNFFFSLYHPWLFEHIKNTSFLVRLHSGCFKYWYEGLRYFKISIPRKHKPSLLFKSPPSVFSFKLQKSSFRIHHFTNLLFNCLLPLLCCMAKIWTFISSLVALYNLSVPFPQFRKRDK